MRESTWRKLDKIYMLKRRRLLMQIYSRDPVTDQPILRRSEMLPDTGTQIGPHPRWWTALRRLWRGR